jgi:hypothetical protein
MIGGIPPPWGRVRRLMALVRPQSANRLIAGVAILIAASLVGCRQTSSEYVEAELRVTSRKVADLENRLAQRDAELETLRHTVTTFQAGHVKPSDAPESVYRDTALSRISLTLATGGKDADVDGKDDGVVVGVAPHDYDGDVFKCPGSCRLQLFEANASGVKRPIGDWVISSDQLRTLWRTSLLGQGYHLTFAWQTAPSERRVTALVTFSTLDGRRFEAEKQFDVSLEAKSPPRLPGTKIEPELPLTPPLGPATPTQVDLPKPPGLGALSSGSQKPALGPRAIIDNGARPPTSTASPNAVPPAVVGAVTTSVNKASVPWDAEHSPPPLLDKDLRGTNDRGKSPGDQADAEDVIVLPASVARPSPSGRTDVDSNPAPLSIINTSLPAANLSAQDRIALPDEPAPPKAASKFPMTIALPN